MAPSAARSRVEATGVRPDGRLKTGSGASKHATIHLLASIVARNPPFPTRARSPFGGGSRGSGEVTSGSPPPRLTLRYATSSAPMAKLDKAPAYEAGDCRFESCSERQINPCYLRVRLVGEGRVRPVLHGPRACPLGVDCAMMRHGRRSAVDAARLVLRAGPSRRGGRAAEGAPLLREYGSKAHRGFESLPLRQIQSISSCFICLI